MSHKYTVDWMSLSHKELLQVIKMISANAVTMDGLWFRGVEKQFGLEAALKIDLFMWERLARTEARRAKDNLPFELSGPLGVARAFLFETMTLALPLPEVEVLGPARTLLYYPHCGIQETREGIGLGVFPCKEVGIAIYENFVHTLDPRVKVRCVCCPPDAHPENYYCAWEFSLDSADGSEPHPQGQKDSSWMIDWESLPKEVLVTIIKMFSLNCYTLDGLWFQGIEKEYGLPVALRHDLQMWQRFSVIEAQRVKEYLDFRDDGVAGVARAMNFETMAPGFPPFTVEEIDANHVLVSYPHCPPQEARVKQGMGEFACKDVGVASWENFAHTIDPRVKVRCDFAPLDPHPSEAWCRWEVYQ